METEIDRTEEIVVRRLRPEDLQPMTSLDAKITGRRREEYFKLKLSESLERSGIVISLAAESDGLFTGFLLARVYYGEFGVMEPVAVLDTLGVHVDFRGRGIGSALMDQLRTDLGALGVTRLQTEVTWDDQGLISFFHHEGFRPAARLSLDLDLAPGRKPGTGR